MTLKQLRYLTQVVHSDLNMSHAAETLYTSQAAISKQILLLEEELGVQLFLRKGKRITRVTHAGQDVLAIARRMIKDAENIRTATQDYKDHSRGSLVIAATPTQIYYSLPSVIQRFALSYPQVRIVLREGSPNQCVERVVAGEADLCISTEVMKQYREITMLPCYQWTRCVVTPHKHPLTKCKPLTLQEIARYPIVTYEFTFASNSKVSHAFAAAHLKPTIVLTAADSQVIKTYVSLGFGIGLVGTTAVNAREDKHLAILDASHLFERSTTAIGVLRNSYLRQYTYHFIELFAPQLTKDIISKARTDSDTV